MLHLDSVAFHLTYVCGNKCSYCYVGEENRAHHPNHEQVQKVLSKILSSDVKEILLVGGDVCLYPKLKEVVSQIKDAGVKCSILSNTLDFGKETEFFVKNFDSIEATVLGASAKKHDAETKKLGSFENLVGNIRKVNSLGIKVKIWVSVSKSNHKEVFALVENLIKKEKLGLSGLGVQRIIPQGRACNSLENSLSESEVEIVFSQLDKIHKELNLPVVFEDPFPLCIVDKKYHYLQTHKCEWGFKIASINFNGGLGRCGADNRFSLGNIFDIPDLQKFWKENQTLKDFRSSSWMPKKCQACELLQKCWCGCSLSRVTAKDHEKDILCSFA